MGEQEEFHELQLAAQRAYRASLGSERANAIRDQVMALLQEFGDLTDNRGGGNTIAWFGKKHEEALVKYQEVMDRKSHD